MTDSELIALYQARDPRAVEETRAQYGAYCAAIARRLLTDGRDVEECLSDCALAVWNAIPPAEPAHFQGWLGAIVRHRALAIGKANGRRPPTVDESALELAASLPAAENIPMQLFLHFLLTIRTKSAIIGILKLSDAKGEESFPMDDSSDRLCDKPPSVQKPYGCGHSQPLRE